MQYKTMFLKSFAKAFIPVPGRSSITSTKFKGKIPHVPLSSPLAHSSFTYSLRIIVSPSEKLSSSFWSPIYSNRATHLGPLHKQKRKSLCLFIIIAHLIIRQHCTKYGLISLIKMMKKFTEDRTGGKPGSSPGSHLFFLRRMSMESGGAGGNFCIPIPVCYSTLHKTLFLFPTKPKHISLCFWATSPILYFCLYPSKCPDDTLLLRVRCFLELASNLDANKHEWGVGAVCLSQIPNTWRCHKGKLVFIYFDKLYSVKSIPGMGK